MTRPRGFDEPPPSVLAGAYARTGAGVPVPVTITITNTAAEPRILALTMLGVDAAWLPRPSRSRPIMPGESIEAVLTLRPAEGTLPARYPVAIAVQALDPVTGQPMSGSTINQLDLIVDAPGQINISLDPVDTSAVFGKKLTVLLHNTGMRAEDVHLDVHAPNSAVVDLPRRPVQVPAGATLPVHGRVSVARPSFFRSKARHSYVVTARGSGAPRYVEGSLTSRAIIGPIGGKVFAVVALLAVWIAVALIVIPGLANKVRKNQAAPAPSAPASSSANGGKKGGGGKGGGGNNNHPQGNGGSQGGGKGGGQGGGKKGGGAAGTVAAQPVQLNGTVTGNAPSGVTVSLASVSLGSDQAVGATSVGGTTTQSAEVGKLPEAAFEASGAQSTVPRRNVTTGTDGAWTFPKVPPVGYYLVTFAKPGYQTQRFIVNAASAVATAPLKVELVAGQGSLQGVVHNGKGRLVGAATVLINDGTNTITTSTNSTGANIGHWSVSGLSTPSTYVVSVSRAGLGTQTQLISLTAGGTGSVTTILQSGVSTLTGHVVDAARNGLGDVQVTATNGADTRTASTVTTGTQKGTYTLPDLTVGRWSVTMQAAGYQMQSRTITLSAGKPVSTVNATLSTATATVDGVVRMSGTNKALVGAGLVLSNNDHTYKQMSISGGNFHFAGVAAGVYTLTAQFFGMDLSSQSVTAIVGKHTHLARFHLKPTVTTNTSTIVGFVANAVASGGSLGCQQLDPPADVTPVLGCTVKFRLLDSAGKPVAITVTHGKPEPSPHKNVALIGPTPYLAEADTGLKPGLYQLTISSTGYLPATITVRVPLNQIAAAPQVSLFPANIISGQLDTIGNINTDGGNTAGNNCVVAVPTGYPITTFNITGFTCAAGSTEISPLQKQCNENGQPAPNFAPVADDGSYRITGLCDGRYSVYVIVGNPAYEQPLASQAADQTVVHGQTIVYSPHIARKGVLTLHVQEVDPASGNPFTPSDMPTLQVTTCGTSHDPVSNLPTDATASAKIFGFAAGAATCTITTTAPGGRNITGDTGTIVMADDTTTSATAVLSGGLAPLFGQVLTKLGPGTLPTPVGGPASGAHANANQVTVHVHAITGYNGTVPITSDEAINTDANGCFAVISSTSVGALPVPTGCGTSGVDPASVLTMNLISQNVSISVDAGPLTQASASQPVQLGTDPATAIAVTATPVNITGAAFTTNVSPSNFNGATTTLLSQLALGSGTVSAGIAGNGQLTWLDSNIGTANLVWPGTYLVKVQVPGFSDSTGTLTCGQVADTDSSFPASKCTLAPSQVNALGALSGTVSSTKPLPGGGNHVNGATVIVRPCADAASCTAALPPPTSACPSTQSGDLTASTNSAGQYSFVGTQTTYFMPLGRYDVFVCAAGLRTAGDQVVVATGANTKDLSMDLLGGIHGTITRSGGSGDPVAGAKVILHCNLPGSCPADKTTTTDGAGDYQFTGPVGQYFMDVGSWQVSVSADGYDPINLHDVSVDSGDNDVSLTMDALGNLTGSVEGQTHYPDTSSTPVPGAKVTITCTSCSPNIVKVATTDSSGQFAFIGTGTPYILKTGSWSMVIDAVGFQEKTNSLTIASGPNNPADPFLIQSLGTVTGTIKGTLGSVTQNLSGAPVTATFCGADMSASCPAPAASDPTTTTDSSGTYNFTSASTPFVLAPGKWQITAKPFGYQPKSDTVQIVRGSYSLNLTTDVRPVDQSVDIIVAGSTTPTKHAVVDFHPADTPATTITTTLVGNDYVASALLPGSYNISISGDTSSNVGQSIIPSSATLTVALSNTGSAGPVPLSVTVVQNSVSGTIKGASGQAATLTPLQNVSVELGTMSGATFTPSTDVGDQPLKAQTLANGTFQINGIPSGTYSVRIDHVTPIDGYDEPAVMVNGANVQFGFAQDLGTISLTRTQQKATLNFPGLAAGDALTGSTAKLVNSTDSSWQLPADVVGTNSITFNSVPFGCWSLALTLPNLHFGASSLTTPSATDANFSCAGQTFTVRGDATSGTADATPSYALDEQQLDVALTVTNLDGTTLPSPIDVKVTRSGGPTFEQNLSNGDTRTIWLPSGSYTISAALPSGATADQQLAYPATSHAATPGTPSTGAITLAQAPATLKVVYTGAVSVTVKATCTGGQTSPANCATTGVSKTDTGSGVSFTNLSAGNWSVAVSGTAGSPAVAVTDPPQSVTLEAGKTKTVTFP